MIKLSIETDKNGLFEITEPICSAIEQSGIKSGIASIWIPHTTAGITVISRMDELGFEDIEDEIKRLIPTRTDFKHQFDTPTDAAGHIKCSLIGNSAALIIEDGKVQMGGSQGIFFFEFDGPRKRECWLQIVGKEGQS